MATAGRLPLMERPLSLSKLDRVLTALPDQNREVLLEELLVACSMEWSQVPRVVEAYIPDYEVRES